MSGEHSDHLSDIPSAAINNSRSSVVSTLPPVDLPPPPLAPAGSYSHCVPPSSHAFGCIPPVSLSSLPPYIFPPYDYTARPLLPIPEATADSTYLGYQPTDARNYSAQPFPGPFPYGLPPFPADKPLNNLPSLPVFQSSEATGDFGDAASDSTTSLLDNNQNVHQGSSVQPLLPPPSLQGVPSFSLVPPPPPPCHFFGGRYPQPPPAHMGSSIIQHPPDMSSCLDMVKHSFEDGPPSSMETDSSIAAFPANSEILSPNTSKLIQSAIESDADSIMALSPGTEQVPSPIKVDKVCEFSSTSMAQQELALSQYEVKIHKVQRIPLENMDQGNEVESSDLAQSVNQGQNIPPNQTLPEISDGLEQLQTSQYAKSSAVQTDVVESDESSDEEGDDEDDDDEEEEEESESEENESESDEEETDNDEESDNDDEVPEKRSEKFEGKNENTQDSVTNSHNSDIDSYEEIAKVDSPFTRIRPSLLKSYRASKKYREKKRSKKKRMLDILPVSPYEVSKKKKRKFSNQVGDNVVLEQENDSEMASGSEEISESEIITAATPVEESNIVAKVNNDFDEIKPTLQVSTNVGLGEVEYECPSSTCASPNSSFTAINRDLPVSKEPESFAEYVSPESVQVIQPISSHGVGNLVEYHKSNFENDQSNITADDTASQEISSTVNSTHQYDHNNTDYMRPHEPFHQTPDYHENLVEYVQSNERVDTQIYNQKEMLVEATFQDKKLNNDEQFEYSNSEYESNQKTLTYDGSKSHAEHDNMMNHTFHRTEKCAPEFSFESNKDNHKDNSLIYKDNIQRLTLPDNSNNIQHYDVRSEVATGISYYHHQYYEEQDNETHTREHEYHYNDTAIKGTSNENIYIKDRDYRNLPYKYSLHYEKDSINTVNNQAENNYDHAYENHSADEGTYVNQFEGNYTENIERCKSVSTSQNQDDIPLSAEWCTNNLNDVLAEVNIKHYSSEQRIFNDVLKSPLLPAETSKSNFIHCEGGKQHTELLKQNTFSSVNSVISKNLLLSKPQSLGTCSDSDIQIDTLKSTSAQSSAKVSISSEDTSVNSLSIFETGNSTIFGSHKLITKSASLPVLSTDKNSSSLSIIKSTPVSLHNDSGRSSISESSSSIPSQSVVTTVKPSIVTAGTSITKKTKLATAITIPNDLLQKTKLNNGLCAIIIHPLTSKVSNPIIINGTSLRKQEVQKSAEKLLASENVKLSQQKGKVTKKVDKSQPKTIYPKPANVQTDVLFDNITKKKKSRKVYPVFSNDMTETSIAKGFFCVECNKMYPTECAIHDTQYTTVSDGVLTKARSSVPAELSLRSMYNQDTADYIGVLSKKYIPCKTKFGPLQGKKTTKHQLENPENTAYVWEIFDEENPDVVLDCRSEEDANWLMFVKRARSSLEQNMLVYQEGHDIYFITIKDIEANVELLYWYGRDYAVMLGVCAEPEESFRCQSCHRQFPDINGLRTHIKAAHPLLNTYVHRCNECGKVFKNKSILSKHQKATHAKLKSYVCPVCNKAFSDRNNQRRHTKLHSEDGRRFQCDECNRKFTQKTHLIDHMAIHSGERNFQCRFCDKRFFRKQDSRHHEKTVHIIDKDYKCELCDTVFYSLRYYKAHCKIHQEKEFKCNYCEKEFTQKVHLKTHLARIHHTSISVWEKETGYKPKKNSKSLSTS